MWVLLTPSVDVDVFLNRPKPSPPPRSLWFRNTGASQRLAWNSVNTKSAFGPAAHNLAPPHTPHPKPQGLDRNSVTTAAACRGTLAVCAATEVYGRPYWHTTATGRIVRGSSGDHECIARYMERGKSRAAWRVHAGWAAACVQRVRIFDVSEVLRPHGPCWSRQHDTYRKFDYAARAWLPLRCNTKLHRREHRSAAELKQLAADCRLRVAEQDLAMIDREHRSNGGRRVLG